MKEIIRKHKEHWGDKGLALSSLTAFALLLASLVFNNFTNIYAASHQSNYVTDIILDNIRPWHVQFLATYGALALIIFIAVLIILEPRRLPFVVKSVALFIVVRAIFMTLTHLAPSPDEIILPTNDLFKLIGISYTSDLFFSGHTGFPFLMALAFWNRKRLRITFILVSVILGSVMLLGHLHYSIDVFGAYFITYTIFHLSTKFFEKDYNLFLTV